MNIETSPDEAARFIALQTAQWFYEATDTKPADDAEVISRAAAFEHYLTDGQTTVITCSDSLRKFVRGKHG